MGNNPIAVFENGELRLNVCVDQASVPFGLPKKKWPSFLASIVKPSRSVFRTFLGKKSSIVRPQVPKWIFWATLVSPEKEFLFFTTSISFCLSAIGSIRKKASNFVIGPLRF